MDLVGVHEGQSTGTRAFRSSPLVRSSRLSPLLSAPLDHRAKHEQGNDEDDEQFANHGLRNRQRVEQHRWDPTLSPPWRPPQPSRRPRTTKNAEHAVIAFVARELVDLPVERLQSEGRRPWSGIRGRVIERVPILDRVNIDTGEPFNEMQALRGPLKARLAVEVAGLDDQRVALPTTTGTSHPLSDALRDRRTPIHRNDTSVMDLLRHDRDVVRRLQEPESGLL